MEEKEKLCCYCERPLKDGDTHTCAQCGALYHQACWEEHGGCSNPAARLSGRSRSRPLLFVHSVAHPGTKRISSAPNAACPKMPQCL